MPETISTNELVLDYVPFAKSSWKNISAFALTFNPKEMGEYGIKAGDLSNCSASSSIMELRAHLYVEQRRWNHFGREPDQATMLRLRNIVAWIRKKLGES
jgi:hypothetical protein